MAKETVIVGCRLPHGLILTVKTASGEKVSVTINGMNRSKIQGATYTTTVVDAEFWEQWKKSHVDYSPLKNGAIFAASTEDQAKYKGIKEYGKEPTGFEPMKQDDLGIKPAAKD